MRRLSFTKIICLSLLWLAATAVSAAAQTGESKRPAPPTPSASLPTNINEDFELNISERRITERDFHAATALEIGDETEAGLNVNVGVAADAAAIDVLLRDVRGRVRFRAALDRLRLILNNRRASAPTPTIP